MRCQVRDLYARGEQEATVADDLLQVRHPRPFAPADPLVPVLQAKRRRAEAQRSEPLVPRAVYEVPDLCSAQRPGPKVVIRLGQAVPDLGRLAVAARHRHDRDLAKLVEAAPDLCHLGRAPPLRSLSCEARHLLAFRKLDDAAALQLQQRLPASDLAELPVGRSPLEPLAHAPRERASRDRRLGLDGGADTFHHLCSEPLAR